MITWEPPFSLNLTDIDPDIVYCVEVYNITCGERGFILGECSLTDLTYDYGWLDNTYVYEIGVTPKSNVNGGDNGTRSIINGRHAVLYMHNKIIILILSLCRAICIFPEIRFHIQT